MSEPEHLQSSSPGTGAVLGQAGCSTSKPAGWWITRGRGHFLRRAATEPLAGCRLHLQGVASVLLCICFFLVLVCIRFLAALFLFMLLLFMGGQCVLNCVNQESFICSSKRTLHRVTQSHGLCSAFPHVLPPFTLFSVFLFHGVRGGGGGGGTSRKSSGGTGLKGALPHIRKGAGQRRK